MFIIMMANRCFNEIVQEQYCYRRHQQAISEEDLVLVAHRVREWSHCWPNCSLISVDSVSDFSKKLTEML